MLTKMLRRYDVVYTPRQQHRCGCAHRFLQFAGRQHLLDAQPIIMKEYMPMVMKRTQERSAALIEG